ncbi:MAG: efflux RND transporter periplasmic adaptor subunit [Elusimicrobiota bacterium]
MSDHKEEQKDGEKSSDSIISEGVSQEPSALLATETTVNAQSPIPSEEKPPLPPNINNLKESWIKANKKIVLIGGFIVVAGLMWAINRFRSSGEEIKEETSGQTTAPDEISVNAVEARMGRFQDVISAVGTIKGEAEIELRFEVDGKIEEFTPRDGAKIRKGQLIARLSDRDARLKVQRAKIELEQTEKLFQVGGVSKTKLDESRLDMEVAQSELDKTRIFSARDGILGDRAADVGEFVNPQRKIGTLVSIKNVVVEVGIIEKQVDKVYPGQKILVSVDAYTGNIFEGAVESISPIISADGSKTFSIRAKIPNPDNLLLPGMFARSRIITYEVDDAISVPNDALVKTTGGFQLFVITPENTAEARDVQVGYVASEFTQIQTGLNPGDVVIVQKPPELKAGSKVKVIEVQK